MEFVERWDEAREMMWCEGGWCWCNVILFTWGFLRCVSMYVGQMMMMTMMVQEREQKRKREREENTGKNNKESKRKRISFPDSDSRSSYPPSLSFFVLLLIFLCFLFFHLIFPPPHFFFLPHVTSSSSSFLFSIDLKRIAHISHSLSLVCMFLLLSQEKNVWEITQQEERFSLSLLIPTQGEKRKVDSHHHISLEFHMNCISLRNLCCSWLDCNLFCSNFCRKKKLHKRRKKMRWTWGVFHSFLGFHFPSLFYHKPLPLPHASEKSETWNNPVRQMSFSSLFCSSE